MEIEDVAMEAKELTPGQLKAEMLVKAEKALLELLEDCQSPALCLAQLVEMIAVCGMYRPLIISQMAPEELRKLEAASMGGYGGGGYHG